MKNDALDKSNEKFLFHLNIFDEAEIVDPTTALLYTETDQAKAKSASFQDGKLAGNKEAQESIQKQTALLMQQVQNSFSLLFAGEDDRESKFEHEVITLTSAIFEKLFPIYHEKFGFFEIQQSVKDMLLKHRDHKKIVLQVAPELEQPIDKILTENGIDNVEVQASANIKGHNCLLSWKDGGAEIKDAAVISEEIRASIKQLLDEKTARGHDKPEGESS